MKSSYRQCLFTLIVGLLFPALTLRLGSLLFSTDHLQNDRPPAQETGAQETGAQKGRQLPILLPDGTVIHMETDTYLVCVLLAEMPTSFELDALKAQAVAARTYAWKRHTVGDKHPQGAVCTDSNCCQAYISVSDYLDGQGFQADVDKVIQAVQATAGQVITYHGALAEATYYSCSGGRTEDAAAVWGEEIPYLKAVDSPGEEAWEEYTNTVSFTPAEFSAALGQPLTGDPYTWFGTAVRSPGDGVASMQIQGQRYTGVELRKLLCLDSTAFTVTVTDGNIVITTKGKGHRVGLSQYGADAMAVLGKTYEEILAYYYPGTVIDKLEALQ